MINDIFGELVPNMDEVEPIEAACTCGCGCMTKSATADTGISAAAASR
jgi:hypothetical protein